LNKFNTLDLFEHKILIRVKKLNHMKLDSVDVGIIKILLNDARKPLSHIAKELKIPVTTVHFRLKKMEKSGLIKGYELYFSPSSIYEKMKNLIIQIKVIPSRINEVKDFIKTSRFFNQSNISFFPYVWPTNANYSLTVFTYAISSTDISLIKRTLTRHPAILDIKISNGTREYRLFKKVFNYQLSKMVKKNG